jgi:hypothetical protein
LGGKFGGIIDFSGKYFHPVKSDRATADEELVKNWGLCAAYYLYPCSTSEGKREVMEIGTYRWFVHTPPRN